VALGLLPATAEEQAALAAIHKKRREEREAEYAATAVATIIAVSPALGAGADMGDQERSFSSWRSPASSDMPPVVPGSPRFPEDFRRVGSPGGAEQTPRLPSHHLKIAGKSLGESRGESKRTGQIVPGHVPRWFARDHASNHYRN
jgi:hypothetical protein